MGIYSLLWLDCLFAIVCDDGEGLVVMTTTTLKKLCLYFIIVGKETTVVALLLVVIRHFLGGCKCCTAILVR